MFKIKFLLLIGLLTLGKLSAQLCGTNTELYQVQYLNSTKALRSNFIALNGSRNSAKVIPVKFHIIQKTDGTGGFDASNLSGMINNLNHKFAQSGVKFFQCGPVNYISNTNFYFFSSDEENTIAWYEEQNVVNVFICKEIQISSGSTVCGYTYLPPGPDRIFVANHCADNGATLAHEFGHYFSLYHTHGKTNLGTTDELVNGSNCTFAGDDLCDTPADPNLSGLVSNVCQYTGTLTDSLGQVYSPLVNNIMSYSTSDCRNSFTPQQYNRIAASAELDRNYLECNSDFNCFSQASDTSGSHIGYIKFGNRTFIDSTCKAYSSRRFSPVNLEVGQTYDLTLKVKNCDSSQNVKTQIEIHIDWNKNGFFGSASDTIIKFPYALYDTIKTQISVSKFRNNANYNMRIVCSEDSTEIDHCGLYNKGETEDLLLVVSGVGCVQNPITTYPYVQNFEGFDLCDPMQSDICELDEGWQNIYTDDYDWTTNSGVTTTPETGPKQDLFPNEPFGKYIYAEASGHYQNKDKTDLISPCFDLGTLNNPELSFAYHMFGGGMGSLKVYITGDYGKTWTNIFEKNGDQDESWHQAKILIDSSFNGIAQFKLEATMGVNRESDIAIDNFSLGEACETDSIGEFSYSENKLEVTFQQLTNNVFQNYWNFGLGEGTSYENNPTYTYDEPGEYNVCLSSNSCGYTSKVCQKINIDTTNLGFELNSLSHKIEIYPNPSQGEITVKWPNKLISQVSIFSTDGQLVKSEYNNHSSDRINLNGLAQGFYIIQINASGGTIAYKRIIVEGI